MIPSNWLLDDDPTHVIHWSSGQCGIHLGALTRSTYTFQPIYVAHAAALIADQCLNEERGYLGGTAEQGMVVVAVGAKPEYPVEDVA